MAIYNMEVQREVSGDMEWYDDHRPLILVIATATNPEQRQWGRRHDIVPVNGVPSEDTKVSWSSPNGNGNITFFDKGKLFLGELQPPGGEPVSYRGRYRG